MFPEAAAAALAGHPEDLAVRLRLAGRRQDVIRDLSPTVLRPRASAFEISSTSRRVLHRVRQHRGHVVDPLLFEPAHTNEARNATTSPALISSSVERVEAAFPRRAEHRIERRQPAAASFELGRLGELRVTGGFDGEILAFPTGCGLRPGSLQTMLAGTTTSARRDQDTGTTA